MKLREFIENLNELVKQYPESLDMEVVTSKDDEGNGYNGVCFSPSVGYYDEDERDFTSLEMFEDYGIGDDELNAICVN